MEKIISATIVKTATVKVMRSHDYNHFEASMVLENHEGVSLKDMNDARVNCAKLTDFAVDQYREMKVFEVHKLKLGYEKQAMRDQVEMINRKPKSEWSVGEQATVKAYEEHNWNLQFTYQDENGDLPF